MSFIASTLGKHAWILNSQIAPPSILSSCSFSFFFFSPLNLSSLKKQTELLPYCVAVFYFELNPLIFSLTFLLILSLFLFFFLRLSPDWRNSFIWLLLLWRGGGEICQKENCSQLRGSKVEGAWLHECPRLGPLVTQEHLSELCRMGRLVLFNFSSSFVLTHWQSFTICRAILFNFLFLFIYFILGGTRKWTFGKWTFTKHVVLFSGFKRRCIFNPSLGENPDSIIHEKN